MFCWQDAAPKDPYNDKTVHRLGMQILHQTPKVVHLLEEQPPPIHKTKQTLQLAQTLYIIGKGMLCNTFKLQCRMKIMLDSSCITIEKMYQNFLTN